MSFPVYTHIGLANKESQKAGRWISKAELVIVAGSKGNYGGYYFNRINPRAKVAQINPKQTQFDGIAVLNIRKNADDVFKLLK